MDERVRLNRTLTSTDRTQPNWNRERFADSGGVVQVEAITAIGAGRNLPQSGMARLAVEFFGLDQQHPGGPRR